MAIGWIVAISKPCRETYAAENLARQRTDCYFPKITEIVERGPRNQRYKLERIVPLFPRYLFVRIEHQWHFILNTFGIAGIIMRGEEPLFAPLSIMQQMWERQDDEGLVQLPRLVRGAAVAVVKGPLAGQRGIYQGMGSGERQRVLLDFLNRRMTVLLQPDAVQLAA